MHKLEEEMFFFKGGANTQLLGFQSSHTSPTGILYCHPFAEEKNCSHAVIAKAARVFAANGFPVFRFDLSGCGDSEGEMTNFTLNDWLADIDAAVSEFKRRASVHNIILWGLRLGATLATEYARLNTNIAGLLLWQPVFNARDFMQQFLRQKLASSITHAGESVSIKSLVQQIESGKTVHVNGYPISELLYSSFQSFGDLTFTPTCPMLVSTISKMALPPRVSINPIENLMAQSRDSMYAHIVAEPFWDRYWQWDSPDVTAISGEWLADFKEEA